MKFHGIDVKGKLWIQRVASKDTTSHSGSVDEGRLIYAEDNERLYIGTNSGWLLITTTYDIISSGTKVLFGHWPFPDSWTLDSSKNDRLAILTNVTGDIGTNGGSWTISGMNTGGVHNHTMQRWSDNNTEVNSNGGKDVAENDHGHYIYEGGGHQHTFNGTWRPAYVKFAVATYN